MHAAAHPTRNAAANKLILTNFTPPRTSNTASVAVPTPIIPHTLWDSHSRPQPPTNARVVVATWREKISGPLSRRCGEQIAHEQIQDRNEQNKI
jgi:hypothetical protein